MKAYIIISSLLCQKICSSFGFELFPKKTGISRRRSANKKKISYAVEAVENNDIIRTLQTQTNAACDANIYIDSYDTIVREVSIGSFDSCTEVFVGGETSPCPGTRGTVFLQLWYILIGNGSNVRAFSVLSDFDTRLAVFTGQSCNELQCIEFSDSVNGSVHSAIEWFAEFEQTYYIRLDDIPCDFYENVPASGSANAYLFLTNPDDDDDEASTPPAFAPTARSVSNPTPSPSLSFIGDGHDNSPSQSPANNGQSQEPTTTIGSTTDPNIANNNRSFSSEEEDEVLNGGVIAIVVGILVLLVAGISVGVFLYLRKRRGRSNNEQQQQKVPQKTPLQNYEFSNNDIARDTTRRTDDYDFVERGHNFSNNESTKSNNHSSKRRPLDYKDQARTVTAEVERRSDVIPMVEAIPHSDVSVGMGIHHNNLNYKDQVHTFIKNSTADNTSATNTSNSTGTAGVVPFPTILITEVETPRQRGIDP